MCKCNPIDKAINKYIERFGITQNLKVCAEEHAELIKALLKYDRLVSNDNPVIRETNAETLKEKIREEFADVLYVDEYIKRLLNISDIEANQMLVDKAQENLRRLNNG